MFKLMSFIRMIDLDFTSACLREALCRATMCFHLGHIYLPPEYSKDYHYNYFESFGTKIMIMLRPSSFGLRSMVDSSSVSFATRSRTFCPILACVISRPRKRTVHFTLS